MSLPRNDEPGDLTVYRGHCRYWRGYRAPDERSGARPADTRDENVADIEQLLSGGPLFPSTLLRCLNIPAKTMANALTEMEREGRIGWVGQRVCLLQP